MLKLDQLHFETLLNEIRENRRHKFKLEDLTINEDTVTINSIQADALFQALEQNTSITELIFHHVYRKVRFEEPVTIARLARMLSNKSDLLSFNVNFEEINVETSSRADIQPLLVALQHLSRLKTLSLSEDADGEIVKALIPVLNNFRALQMLFLDECQIGDEEAIDLADVLKQNHTLHMLFLDENEISNVGAQAFADMLQYNDTLKFLSFDNNQIDRDGKQMFIDVIYKKLEDNFNIIGIKCDSEPELTEVAQSAIKRNTLIYNAMKEVEAVITGDDVDDIDGGIEKLTEAIAVLESYDSPRATEKKSELNQLKADCYFRLTELGGEGDVIHNLLTAFNLYFEIGSSNRARTCLEKAIDFLIDRQPFSVDPGRFEVWDALFHYYLMNETPIAEAFCESLKACIHLEHDEATLVTTFGGQISKEHNSIQSKQQRFDTILQKAYDALFSHSEDNTNASVESAAACLAPDSPLMARARANSTSEPAPEGLLSTETQLKMIKKLYMAHAARAKLELSQKFMGFSEGLDNNDFEATQKALAKLHAQLSQLNLLGSAIQCTQKQMVTGKEEQRTDAPEGDTREQRPIINSP